jgi:spermidine synthase
VSDTRTDATTGSPRRLFWGIFILSLAVLVLQIALTRVLSVVLWYHFAFVAISLAMLGLALAGIVLYVAPRLLLATDRLLPWYCRLAGVAAFAALAFVIHASPQVGGTAMSTGAIIAVYLVLLIPFALAGLAVSATLSFHSGLFSRLYARDLVGAGLGCLLVVPLLDWQGAPTTVLASGAALLLAGWVYAGRVRSAVDIGLGAGAVLLLALNLWAGVFEPTVMHGVPDEDLARGAVREFAGWNSHSRIVVTRDSDWGKTINIDGSATTGAYRMDRTATQGAVREQLNWMPLRSGSMPYVALGDATSPDVMLIGPGGGLDLLNGIFYGARITAVELNGLIYQLMKHSALGRWAGDIYNAPGVTTVHDEARSWLRRSEQRFDLVQASMIDTWAATAGGAFALAENALYTVEAFVDYYEHLTERGLVHFMRWNESPPRQSLRLLALVTEAMRRVGVSDAEPHVVMLEEPSWPNPGMPMASLLWAKRPLEKAALDRLQAAIAERSKVAPVRALCWPGEKLDNELSRYLRATDKAAFLRGYPFDVRPTTDDQPFFFHTAQVGNVAATAEAGFENEEAVRVLYTVLWTVLAITAAAFFVPLLVRLRRVRRGQRLVAVGRLGYFGCLGLGFMLVEIPVLQRFGLFMGHPTWTLSTVLCALLVAAGLGGVVASKLQQRNAQRRLLSALLLATAALCVMAMLAPPTLAVSIAWSFPARVALTAAFLLPIGFVLGMALPLGMRQLHDSDRELVPWAWGLNGGASVLASVVAVVIGMQYGFVVALYCGIACYALAFVLAAASWRSGGTQAAG